MKIIVFRTICTLQTIFGMCRLQLQERSLWLQRMVPELQGESAKPISMLNCHALEKGNHNYEQELCNHVEESRMFWKMSHLELVVVRSIATTTTWNPTMVNHDHERRLFVMKGYCYCKNGCCDHEKWWRICKIVHETTQDAFFMGKPVFSTSSQPSIWKKL